MLQVERVFWWVIDYGVVPGTIIAFILMALLGGLNG